MGQWYSRPVLFVADVDAALAFYVGQLGFAEAWKFTENDGPGVTGPARPDAPTVVAQVNRDGCEIILSVQRPDKAGKAMLFIALTAEDWAALPEAFAAREVAWSEGWWGYRSLIVADPAGNQLYFPDPTDPGGG